MSDLVATAPRSLHASSLPTFRERPVVPLSDVLLRRHNFFDLYPPDVIGADDLEYARRVLEENALGEYGTLPRLDFHRYEKWRTVEKSCLINRFYFLPPLAKRAALTRDESLARLIVDTMLHFIDSFPPPPTREAVIQHQTETYWIRDNEYNKKSYDEIQRDETDVRYIWFDMQPASRAIHFLHALHFLREFRCITPDEWRKMCFSLHQHAETILHGEFVLKLLVGDNHQSLRAVALLMVGGFLKGVGRWKEFVDDGVRIIQFHSREGFFADGALKEISPSYHFMVAWHVRDAVMLSRLHGFALDPACEQQLRRSLAYARAVCDPRGVTVVFNNGREVCPKAFLESMEFLGETSAAQETSFFPDAGVAVLQRAGFYLLLDASPFTGVDSHYQAGKNAPVLWLRDKPFLADSGCCLYDDELFSKWYKQAEAHSTLLVDGAGDSRLKGIYDWQTFATVRCDGWQRESDGTQRIAATLTSNDPAWTGIRWTRTIRVTPANTVEIADRVESPRRVQLSFVFNLHPDVAVECGPNAARLRNGGVVVRCAWQSRQPLRLETQPGRCYTGSAHRDAQRILIHLEGDGTLDLHTHLTSL